MIFRWKSFEWLELSIESDLGIRFAVWSLDIVIPFLQVPSLLIFVIWENEIFKSVILYFFRLWTMTETPQYDPLIWTSSVH